MRKALGKEDFDETKGVQKTNWIGVGHIFILLVLIFPVVVPTSFYITQITFVGIYVIVAIGLGLLMGYAGQISLGQAAFYGLGAYTTAVLTTTLRVKPMDKFDFFNFRSCHSGFYYGIYDVKT